MIRATIAQRTEWVGGALVRYGDDGKAEYASAGWDGSPSIATAIDLVRVRRLIAPEKMTRVARRIAA